MSPLPPWLPQTLATVTIGLSSLYLVTHQLAAVRRKNEFDIMREVDRLMSNRHSKGAEDFYAIARHFQNDDQKKSVDSKRWHEESLLARILLAQKLPEQVWVQNIKTIRSVTNTYNDISQLLELGLVKLRPFLSKYHLTILREGWIIEPYIYAYSKKNPGRWGFRVLRLLEAARKYHELNAIHKQDVYILAADGSGAPNTSIGMVWKVRRVSVMHKLGWLMKLIPRMSESQKRSQNRAVEKALSRANNQDRSL